jgi:thioredoxin reductase
VTLSNGQELTCKSLLIATGVSLRELNVPGIRRLTGAGIYYGAALGDVRQGAVRRVASAVGYGAVAVSLIHQYIKTV